MIGGVVMQVLSLIIEWLLSLLVSAFVTIMVADTVILKSKASERATKTEIWVRLIIFILALALWFMMKRGLL